MVEQLAREGNLPLNLPAEKIWPKSNFQTENFLTEIDQQSLCRDRIFDTLWGSGFGWWEEVT